MATSASAAPMHTTPVSWTDRAKPYLVPYYFALAGLLGLITVVFAVVVALLIMVALNFNVLGWIE